MLNLSSEQLQKIYQHAQDTYPEECCGLLLGTLNQEEKIVTEVWQTENSWTPELALPGLESGSRRNRFSVAPELMLYAQKYARDEALIIVGIYHSHPNGQPIPSEFDRAIAWSEYSYLIVGLTPDTSPDLKSWTLNEERIFEPEVITVNQ
jgi:proteasome lid subunit RPN8/RPN11